MTKRHLCLLVATGLGCGVDAAPNPEPVVNLQGREQAIVYGTDDRQDLYAVEDPKLRELARSSAVALIDLNLLHRPNSGAVGLVSPTLAQAYGLCEDQPFRTQPAAATCSGVLIDRDLVVTAGHCVTNAKECESYAFVFDYAYRDEGELEDISASDVYGCRRLVARTFTDASLDYAIVQLDRVPSGRTPAALRRTPLQKGAGLSVLGFASGLPLKVDQGARVKDARAAGFDYFQLDSDTFEGSSGSGVFDSDLALAGVLVRGGEDYVKTADGCREARVIPSDAGTPDWDWEQATYVERAVQDLCDQGYPSRALCDVEPRCGDGFCSFDPVDADCAEDCAEGACSDTGCTKSARRTGSAGEPVEAAVAPPADCSLQPSARHSGWLLTTLSLLGAAYLARRQRVASALRRLARAKNCAL